MYENYKNNDLYCKLSKKEQRELTEKRFIEILITHPKIKPYYKQTIKNKLVKEKYGKDRIYNILIGIKFNDINDIECDDINEKIY